MLARHVLAVLALTLLAGAAPSGLESQYELDPRYGTIGFRVTHLGLWSSEGEFRRFHAELAIDPAHPERTRIAVTIAAGSVQMAWAEAAAMLRSPDYFDAARHPDIRFASTAVSPEGPDRYRIRGELEIRGITRPETLDARLTGQHFDPARQSEVADFDVTGALHRSDFGMLADSGFISDQVKILIHAHLQLGAALERDRFRRDRQ